MNKNPLTTIDNNTFQFSFFLEIKPKTLDHRVGHLDRYFPRKKQITNLNSGWLHGQVQSGHSGGLPICAHLDGYYHGDELTLLETSAFPAFFHQNSHLFELRINNNGIFEGHRLSFKGIETVPYYSSKPYHSSRVSDFSLSDLIRPKEFDLDVSMLQKSTYWGNIHQRDGIRLNYDLFNSLTQKADEKGIVTPYNDSAPESIPTSTRQLMLSSDDIPF